MHCGGAARVALKWGTIMGQGIGLQGSTYAIPTMFQSTIEIKPYVDEFICFAQANPNLTFLVTEIGCGIAGFTANEIAPLFFEASKINNIHLPRAFWEVIKELQPPKNNCNLEFKVEKVKFFDSDIEAMKLMSVRERIEYKCNLKKEGGYTIDYKRDDN